jgi:hypothetical protein
MQQPCSHIVQLYGEDTQLLRERAARFLGEGLALGEPALVIASARHCDAFVCQLAEDGHDPISAIRSGRLVLMDSARLLRELMVEGKLDWETFERTAGGAIRTIRSGTGAARLRAYGEMVGILWQAGRAADAELLEEYWNRLMADGSFSLFCGYPVDLLDAGVDAAALAPLLTAHSGMEVAGPAFEHALSRAMDAVLGDAPARTTDHRRGPIPAAEASVLWLHEAYPERTAEVLDRARYYQSSHLRAG